MTQHTIRKGFDIPLAGAAAFELVEAPEPVAVALQPGEFYGIKPKLLVREGDEVVTGQPLFFDKRQPAVRWCSPATGKVTGITFGARRFPERIEITLGSSESFHADGGPVGFDSMDRAALRTAIQEAGLWPMLRQRPLAKIADPEGEPAAIFVNGLDTEPLAADPAFAVKGQGEALRAGLALLRKLTDGKVYFTVRADKGLSPEFEQLDGAERHAFGGPHPAGLVGTHIAQVQPLRTNETAWYLKAQELVQLGAWALSGRYPTHRVVALAGSGAPDAKYFRVRSGAVLPTITGGKAVEGDWRIINGTVLSGDAVDSAAPIGFYAYTVTVMPEGAGKRDLFGWALPQFGKLSASRSVNGGLSKDAYDADARMHGGKRAMVNIGQMEAMTPLDILPTYLIRAIQAGDLEEALQLGLLEVAEEDVALCTFADPCKTEVGPIIRQGLDLFEKES